MANSLMLSSQTKDEVNYAARFMELGLIVGNILATEEEKLDQQSLWHNTGKRR